MTTTWTDTLEDHCRNAIMAYVAAGRQPSVEDWRRIRVLCRRASLEASRQIAALELSPPRVICKLCGEPLQGMHVSYCPACAADELADAEAYGDEAVDLSGFRTEGP